MDELVLLARGWEDFTIRLRYTVPFGKTRTNFNNTRCHARMNFMTSREPLSITVNETFEQEEAAEGFCGLWRGCIGVGRWCQVRIPGKSTCSAFSGGRWWAC